MTLIDSNVLLDVLTRDPTWADWSLDALDAAAIAGPLQINDVIYAEISSRFESIEPLDAFVDGAGLQITPMPRAALFLASKAYARYRVAGGAKIGVLPDFFIGAHAAVNGYELLTRDVSRYRAYFPDVKLISPNLS